MPGSEGGNFTQNQHSALLGSTLKDQIPEISDFTRVRPQFSILKANNKSFMENGLFVDNNFLTLFTFHLKAGNAETVLKESNSIVISERMAIKFFNTLNCIGKTLELIEDNKTSVYQISGILQNVPYQSSMKFDFIIPFSSFLANNKEALDLKNSSNNTWLLLKQNTDAENISSKINTVINTQINQKDKQHFIIPLKDRHLYNYTNGKRSAIGRILDAYIFSAVAILILLIACFNYMNLSIAFTSKRYGEAGMKKVLGSSRKKIASQFLSESVILTLFSFCLALGIAMLLLPAYSSFSRLPEELTIPFNNFGIMTGVLGFTIVIGIIFGIYPAVIFSSFSTKDILKRTVSVKDNLSTLRQGLIVFQFVISVVFITSSIIIWKQAYYLNNKDLGINKDNILYFENREKIKEHQTAFKSELLSIKEVASVCYTNSKPFESVEGSVRVEWAENPSATEYTFALLNTDYDFAETLQPKLLTGRFFDSTLATDVDNFIINETAANIINAPNPIGTEITVNGKKGTIIGLVKNFHTSTLFTPFFPVIIKINPPQTFFTVIKFSSSNRASLSENIMEKYKIFEKIYPINIQFVSDTYSKLNNRNEAAILTGFFGGIAILLACLGLFGLAALNTEKRTKEIGIRKINGATNSSIVILLFRNYAKWVTIGICLGLPISLLIGKAFLGIFAFRIDLPFWAFIVGPIMVMCIALLTVSWLSWKAATRNPVEALRYE
jgi:ABC-type antimicrobial peptide transport system permease subunit